MTRQAPTPGVAGRSTYPINDADEIVTCIAPGGSCWQFVQRWACGLADAPLVGEPFRVLRDEWFRDEQDVQFRVIHEWEVSE
jgi:hypothetical protein